MHRRTVAALTALALLPLAACSAVAAASTDELSYQVDQSVTALVIDARAAAVAIEAAAGPVTVTERYKYSKGKPSTSHRVDGQTLQLTESGCDDDARCETEYRIRMPKELTADVTAQAGAVKITGLAGDVHVTTEAGSVEALALASAEVVVKTQAGAASLQFMQPPALVKATTELGAVEVRVPGSATYAVQARTKVGAAAVAVQNDPASAHRIDVTTDVGAVKIEPLP